MSGNFLLGLIGELGSTKFAAFLSYIEFTCGDHGMNISESFTIRLNLCSKPLKQALGSAVTNQLNITLTNLPQ